MIQIIYQYNRDEMLIKINHSLINRSIDIIMDYSYNWDPGGTHGVMDIVIGNGHSKPSSNPG